MTPRRRLTPPFNAHICHICHLCTWLVFLVFGFRVCVCFFRQLPDFLAGLYCGRRKETMALIEEHIQRGGGKCPTDLCNTHFLGSFERTTALFASKPTPSGWRPAPSLRRATPFCSSPPVFCLQSLPCSRHCQPSSRAQAPDQRWGSSEGREADSGCGEGEESRRRRTGEKVVEKGVQV